MGCRDRHKHLRVQPRAPVHGPQRLRHLFHDIEVIEVELLGNLQGETVIFYDVEEVVVLIAYAELKLQGGEFVDVGLNELVAMRGQGERITHEHAMDGAQVLGVDGDVSPLRSMMRRPLSRQ